MVRIHPVTRQRFVHAKHIGDMIIDADPPTRDDALTNEDVPLIGPFDDDTLPQGQQQGGPPSKQQQMFGGHANELFATVAWVESRQNLDNLSAIGTSSDTRRRRRKKLFVDLSNG